jgi:hypothetical protein
MMIVAQLEMAFHTCSFDHNPIAIVSNPGNISFIDCPVGWRVATAADYMT